jgi:hypothetical protein
MVATAYIKPGIARPWGEGRRPPHSRQAAALWPAKLYSTKAPTRARVTRGEALLRREDTKPKHLIPRLKTHTPARPPGCGAPPTHEENMATIQDPSSHNIHHQAGRM